MGVWEDFMLLSETYYVILDRYYSDFSPRKGFWCKKGEDWCHVEITFLDCDFEVLKLVDNSLCELLPEVRLVEKWPPPECADIDITFLVSIYYGFEIEMRFDKDVRFRFWTEEDEEDKPVSFHVVWRLAGSGEGFEGEVIFDRDPSEEEVVKAIIEDVRERADLEKVFVKNIDEVVRDAVKIVSVLAKYMSRRAALFELFP